MMKKAAITILSMTLIASMAVNASATDRDLWLHVAVDGVGADPERVRVNVPLTLVEAVLPIIEESEFRHGKIMLDHQEFRHEDIVQILRAVRDAQDGEYVTIEDYGDTVQISKDSGYILIEVRERGRRGAEVDVRVPVAVLDALVSGADDELDLLAAIEALGEHGEGDLVTVNDRGETVRVWVDRDNVSEPGEIR